MATGRLIFKYSAARRPRRADILDQRGSAWKWTELSPTFSASDVSTRQANVACDLPAPRELSCAPTEELRQLLVRLVEHGTFSRWPPISRRNHSVFLTGLIQSSAAVLLARVERWAVISGKKRGIGMFGKGRASERFFAPSPRINGSSMI
jgi:hypothetical protein